MAIYDICEGATIQCTLGTATSALQVPQNHDSILKGKKQATIDDYKGNANIMPFGACARTLPPPPCSPTIVMPWLMGQADFKLRGQLSLLNICIVPCVYGGVISIVDPGQ